jgi:hypothetical protein
LSICLTAWTWHLATSICLVRWKPPWWQTFHWWWRGQNEGVEVAETTVKRLLCCGFQRTDKAMEQVHQCWWRIWQEIYVFSRFEYHMLYVSHPFLTYLLTLPHKSTVFTQN